MNIDTQALNKTFGSFRALNDINIRIASGELLALLGPSGSGKTTLLRIIAGLEVPDTGGGVYFNDKEVTFLSARDRGVGFVFQHYALFRHMSVFENIAFGLKVRPRRERPGKDEIAERVHRLLKLVQLEGLHQRLPAQLSGGQRQRVALARALAVDPKVLLLDEPFGALDAKVRKELRRWLRKLHEEIQVTSIFVTHDQEEALELADRVVVMSNGKIEQIGTPEEVYNAPANPFVFNFLGEVNAFDARIENGVARVGNLTCTVHNVRPDQPAAVAFVRPHELNLHRDKPIEGSWEVEVVHLQPVGSVISVEVIRKDSRDHIGVEITRELYRQLGIKRGDTLHLTAQRLHVFPADPSR